MPRPRFRLSLTDFIDIVAKSGSPKATKVTQVKTRPDYDPAFDFYKPIRDKIIEIHEYDFPKKALFSFLSTITDHKKLQNYPRILEGYKKWWGRKELVWFKPPNNIFTDQNIGIMINPELGLSINNHKRYIIKLYLKSEKLTKFKVEVINYLMQVSLSNQCKNGEIMAVLDVRQSKIFEATTSFDNTIKALLSAELAYIANLWDNV